MRLSSLMCVMRDVITGAMSDCPGYLSIIINDRSAVKRLFHYDVLMSCPARFNLTFPVPRTPSFTANHRVQTFEVVLDDAKRTYQLLLNYFRSADAAENDGIAENGAAAEAYSSKVVQGHTSDVTKVVTACVMMVVICLSVRLLCDVTVLRRKKPSVTVDPDDVTQPAGSVSTVDHSQRRHFVFIAIYVGFNVIYCVLVTFTVVSAVFVVHFRPEIDQLTSGGQRLGNLTRLVISDVEVMSTRSLQMELELAERKGHQLPVACARYIDDMADRVRQSVANVTRRRNSTSVSGLMSAVINSTAADAERRVLKYVGDLEKEFERRAGPARHHRRRLLGQVVNSNWLLYARSLYNRSTALSSLTTSSSSSSAAAAEAAGEGDEVMRFLTEMLSVPVANRLRWYKPARLQRSVLKFCRRYLHVINRPIHLRLLFSDVVKF